MSKVKRKAVFEGNKSAVISSTVARPSVFERLGPNSSSAISSVKTQIRKIEDTKHKGHEKSSSSHSRESVANATESLAKNLTPKKVRKRSRSRDRKEQATDVRSKISFRPSESGDHKSKELTSHSPSPKRASTGENRRKEPETKIKSQVAVVTNRQSTSKAGEKGANQPNEADWRTDRSHLDFQEESILERKRKQLQRELELEMQKERLEEKRVSSSSSRSTSSAASSSSSNSDSSSSSSSSSSSEDNSFSSISSLNAKRKKTKPMLKRPTKIISSQSGSNSETDIIRANKKGKVDQKSDLKKKVLRNNDGDLRKDQQLLKVNQEKKRKLITTGGSSKPKLPSGGVVDVGLRANLGGSSSSKHSVSQVKANERIKKGGANISHKDNPYSETLKIRDRSVSPNAGISSQSRSNKSATGSLKQSIFSKKKHNSDSSSVDVLNKSEKLKQSSRTKNLSDSHKFKPQAPSGENIHGSRKVISPNVRGRHTPPNVSKINESSHTSTRVSKEKRVLKRPASPLLPPQSSRLSDIDRSKLNRERRHSNSEITTKSFDSNTKKSPKDMKERKKEGNQVGKTDRFRDDQKSSRTGHVSDIHTLHSKHESDRGRDVKRQRDVDSHSHSTERSRLTESRGMHSPLRREISVGKKSERMTSGSQHPGREGIIDRLRDLSRTSMDLSGDYHGRRDSSGRNIPENPPEARNLIDDRLGRVNVERDRRGRLLPEEVNSRYEPPDILDHRRRMLTPPPPPPGKYHSRNLTPPRSTTSPPLPPRQWSRDHPDPREPVLPYPPDRRKSPPLPHHYGARSYNDADVYDYDNRSDHRGRDQLNQRGQRKDSYHQFLPSDPIDLYDRDGRPRSRQGMDYGHNDQRRDDYRWENPRDDRLKGIPEPDRLRESDRWHDDEIKRKRAREELQEQSSLPKRRRITPPLLPPPAPIENLRGSRVGASTETGRTADSNKRKQLSDSGKGSRSTILDGNKTFKPESSVQPSDIKNIDRNKRRSEPVKELNSENKNSKIDDTKRKRPRTPEKSDRPSKSRKTSPVHAAIEKPAEKIVSSEPKTVVDKEKILVVPAREEIKPKLGDDKPASPSAENAESFSDWSDDSMDLLNQEEKDKAAKQAASAEPISTEEIETTLAKDSNVEVVPIIKDEKISALPSEVLNVEKVPLLQKDDKRLRKPKSEGGEDSRGSFEDGLKEKRSRDLNRISSIKSKSTTSRHPSLERSTRRRYHELNKDKSRSKASSPVSRPRTPVSRPRTPVSPPRNVSESVPERDKKPPAKIVDNIIPSVTDSVESLQTAISDEKVTAALDDCEYDPISDDELEAMMEEPDIKDLESVKNVKQSSADTLDVDWASLVRVKSKPPSEVNKESVLKNFTPASVLSRIGVSSQLAGAELLERIEKVITDDYASRENDTDSAPPKFVFEEKIASLHAMNVVQKKERQTILDDIGPYRQALCARRDLKIRKKLCKLKLKEISPLSLNSVDVETFKLGLQIFSQRRSNVGLG